MPDETKSTSETTEAHTEPPQGAPEGDPPQADSLAAGSGSEKYGDPGVTDWLDRGRPDFEGDDETKDPLPDAESEPDVLVVEDEEEAPAPAPAPEPPPLHRAPPLAEASHRPGFAPPPAAAHAVVPATPPKAAGGMRNGNALPVASRGGGVAPPKKATR